jgi:hypothetical protein
MEAIKQTFNGNEDFGSSVTATISRNGDLVYRMYLEHDASFTQAGSDTICIGADYGSHVMKECELEIGGQRIDRHYGHWHSVYSQLTESNPGGHDQTLFSRMCGNGTELETHGGVDANGWAMTDAVTSTAKGKFWIPLYFWFCRNPGLALPLIALQYHEVKVKITFEDVGKLIAIDTDDGNPFGTSTANTSAGLTGNVVAAETKFELWADYIYLDTDERRRFAQVSHEYLIEQLQFKNEGTGGSINLNFNHPVKELIWSGIRSEITTDGLKGFLYDRDPVAVALTNTVQLKLNGHDRFKERDTRYFTRTQIWESHTGYGCTEVGDTIAVYSFALKPEEHQPSGTCNFSRIDNAELVQSAAQPVNIYAINYNVLRIMSGMGGLAYSN